MGGGGDGGANLFVHRNWGFRVLFFSQVRYVSDLFKVRPPLHGPEEEELERKPSLSLTLTLGEADHNHFGYPSGTSSS